MELDEEAFEGFEDVRASNIPERFRALVEAHDAGEFLETLYGKRHLMIYPWSADQLANEQEVVDRLRFQLELCVARAGFSLEVRRALLEYAPEMGREGCLVTRERHLQERLRWWPNDLRHWGTSLPSIRALVQELLEDDAPEIRLEGGRILYEIWSGHHGTLEALGTALARETEETARQELQFLWWWERRLGAFGKREETAALRREILETPAQSAPHQNHLQIFAIKTAATAQEAQEAFDALDVTVSLEQEERGHRRWWGLCDVDDALFAWPRLQECWRQRAFAHPREEVRLSALHGVQEVLQERRDKAHIYLPAILECVERGYWDTLFWMLPLLGRVVEPHLPWIRERVRQADPMEKWEAFVESGELASLAWLQHEASPPTDANSYTPESTGSVALARARSLENRVNGGAVVHGGGFVDAALAGAHLHGKIRARWLELALQPCRSSHAMFVALELIEGLGPLARDLLPTMRRMYEFPYRSVRVRCSVAPDEMLVERLGEVLERVGGDGALG